MLKLFDKNHNAIGHLVKYKDCKIESDVSTGDKTLTFTYLDKTNKLENEMYIRTQDDEYVIKEVPADSNGFPEIVAVLNLEELQEDSWRTFSVTDTTIDAATRTAIAGTGWTIGTCDVTKKRNAGMMYVNTLGVIENLCKAFMCEVEYDTINKKISFYQKRGETKGTYFLSGLNLKRLQKKSDSHDFYTRVIPLGEDGLTIESVNEGKNYLDNFQYSDKVISYIWKEESYTDPQALMEDAELWLNDRSKPEVSYQVKVRNLATQNDQYSVLSYKLGDTVKIIDQETGIIEEQRIVSMTQYPDNPNKDTCDISNTFLTFEEMQSKYQEATEIINYTVTGEGRYTGTINVSDILHFESGITGSTTIQGIQGDIGTLEAKVGSIEINYLRVDEAKATYATIENLKATNATVENLEVDYGKFKTLTTEELAADKALIKHLNTEVFDAETGNVKFAYIDFANIGSAAMETFYAKSGLIKDVVIDNEQITGHLLGVTITGDLIEANTVKADKLMIKGEDGLYYKLNTDGETVEAQQTDYNSLNGSVIVAKSITATKIAVEDLKAFGATIGGFVIGENSIHSLLKESVDSAMRGTYMDKDGQIAFGDNAKYIKYYKDAETEEYNLAISAASVLIGDMNVATAITEAKTAAGDGAKTATNYLYFDAANGLIVTEDAENYNSGYNTQIVSNAVNIRSGENILAQFGSTVTIGQAAGRNLYIDSDAVDIRNGEAVLAQFGETIAIGQTDGENIYIDSDSVDIRAGSTVLAQFGSTVTIGSATGRNLYIDSDSVDIRSGSTQLATFTSNSIALGMNAVDSRIMMCGGTFNIHAYDDAYNNRRALIYSDSSRFYVDFNSNVVVSGSVWTNDGAIYMQGAKNATYLYVDSNAVIGYGSNGELMIGQGFRFNGRKTCLDGGDICMRIASEQSSDYTTLIPYFRRVDGTHSVLIHTAGYVTSSKKEVWFTIPLTKPIIGNPTIDISSVNGFILRQNNAYTHGSNWSDGAYVYAKPSTITAERIGDSGIRVTATFSNTTNAINNAPIGIIASVKWSFS